jgi:ABC-2 type transport system ATP-binding protein
VAAVIIDRLVKTFQGKKGTKVDALKGISLTLNSGEIFGFLGPNGAGKSTTIKILMGLIRPTAGSAQIEGIDCRLDKARDHVGYLPENPAFYDFLSAEEYLRFVGRVFAMSGHDLEDAIINKLHLLELWDARRRPIRSYSKGMVQRLGLAQALLHDPAVYILDEPMSGLDPLGRALVKNIILDLRSRGKTVFFSTHITSDVESVCDRVGIILNGELKIVEQVETIVRKGIAGYVIRTVADASDRVEQLTVGQNELADVMSRLKAEGKSVSLIEARRNNLEDFFLEVVKEDRS